MIRRLRGISFADVYLEKEKSSSELVAVQVLKKKYRIFNDFVELLEVKSLQKPYYRLKHSFFKRIDMKKVNNSNFYNDFGDLTKIIIILIRDLEWGMKEKIGIMTIIRFRKF